MSVRAKFKVARHETSLGWNSETNRNDAKIGTVKLFPVTGDSDENKRFYQATPGGSIELSTVNTAVLDMLPLGAEVYVDFTPAEPKAG